MRLPWWSPALWVGLCLVWRKDAGILALLGYHMLSFGPLAFAASQLR